MQGPPQAMSHASSTCHMADRGKCCGETCGGGNAQVVHATDKDSETPDVVIWRYVLGSQKGPEK